MTEAGTPLLDGAGAEEGAGAFGTSVSNPMNRYFPPTGSASNPFSGRVSNPFSGSASNPDAHSMWNPSSVSNPDHQYPGSRGASNPDEEGDSAPPETSTCGACCQFITSLACAIGLPLTLFLIFYNTHCVPDVRIFYFICFGLGVCNVCFGQHVRTLHGQKNREGMYGCILIMMFFSFFGFSIWSIILGWGKYELSTDGCVVLVTYIKVVGVFSMVMLSCFCCLFCLACLGGGSSDQAGAG